VTADARPSAPSLASSVGVSLLLASLGATALVVPAASRAAGGEVSFVDAWLCLSGGTALLIGPAAAALRIARPVSRAELALPLGLALSAAPLIVFARLLKVSTHHRPLGAVTYAIVALGLILGATAFAARLLAWSGGSRAALRRFAPLLAAAAAGALALLLSLPLLKGLGAQLLDAALAIALWVVAAFLALPARVVRTAARVGAALWVAVVVGGLLVPAKSRDKVALEAPVLSGLVGWFRAAR
jgi:hypothetical protein